MSVLSDEEKKNYIQKRIDDTLMNIQKWAILISELKRQKGIMNLENELFGYAFDYEQVDREIFNNENCIKRAKSDIVKMRSHPLMQ
jgi:hypothetical protein